MKKIFAFLMALCLCASMVAALVSCDKESAETEDASAQDAIAEVLLPYKGRLEGTTNASVSFGGITAISDGKLTAINTGNNAYIDLAVSLFGEGTGGDEAENKTSVKVWLDDEYLYISVSASEEPVLYGDDDGEYMGDFKNKIKRSSLSKYLELTLGEALGTFSKGEGEIDLETLIESMLGSSEDVPEEYKQMISEFVEKTEDILNEFKESLKFDVKVTETSGGRKEETVIYCNHVLKNAMKAASKIIDLVEQMQKKYMPEEEQYSGLESGDYLKSIKMTIAMFDIIDLDAVFQENTLALVKNYNKDDKLTGIAYEYKLSASEALGYLISSMIGAGGDVVLDATSFDISASGSLGISYSALSKDIPKIDGDADSYEEIDLEELIGEYAVIID